MYMQDLWNLQYQTPAKKGPKDVVQSATGHHGFTHLEMKKYGSKHLGLSQSRVLLCRP